MIKEKIVLIDFNNLYLSCYCADPLVNKDNVHIGGISSSFKILQKICSEIKPHKIIAVWDGKGSTAKRRNLIESYKEGRSAPKPLSLNRYFQYDSPEKENENRRWQQARLIELLGICPIVQICESGVEADDIIAYLCQSYKKDAMKIIVSNDKDYLQLVEDNVVLYRFSQKKFLAKKDVVVDYGVLPSNMALVRAIEGDKSDNLPGVHMVGIKTILKYAPEVAKKENILFDEFYELIEKKFEEKGKKSLKTILDSKEAIERNYQVMQLYSPLIDASTAIDVEKQINEKQYEFNLTNFNFQIMKDGMYYSEFVVLVDHFIKILNYNKNK